MYGRSWKPKPRRHWQVGPIIAIRYYLPAILTCLAYNSAALAQISGGQFAATSSEIVPRLFHAGSVLQHGPVMISGGLGLQIFPPSLYSHDQISFYDPGSQTFGNYFEPLDGGATVYPQLITPRSSHTQTTLRDGRVVITGGSVDANGTNPGSPTASVEIFDPVTGVIAAGPAMARPRTMHSASMLADGRVVVAGEDSWQVFYPPDNQWSPEYTLARSRGAHAAVELPNHAGSAGDHRVLLIAGSGSGGDTIELLNPADGTTELLTSTLTIGVDDLAAILLPDGWVLIVGGQNLGTGNTLSDTYLLDPVADLILAGPTVPNRPDGIADHQIARFTDYVVIFGGEQQVDGVDTILDYAAIFDSNQRMWIDDGQMLDPHDDFVAVPLPDCSLLLVGGGVSLFGLEIPSVNCEVFTLTIEDQCLCFDFDDDGDIDNVDYAAFEQCLTGPQNDAAVDCLRGDFDDDGDIDLEDYAAFSVQFDSP